MARRSVVLLVALLASTATAAAAVALAAGSATPSVEATAIDADTGNVLPSNPELRLLHKVIITAVGFKPGARVQIGLEGVKLFQTAPADGSGHVEFDFTVPDWIKPGQHELLFAGRAASLERGTLPSSRRLPRRDVQDIEVVVPLTDPWRFRTPGSSSGTPSLSVSGTQAHHGHGPPAHTGVDVLGLIATGLLALAVGAVALRAGRRRRRRDAAPRTH